MGWGVSLEGGHWPRLPPLQCACLLSQGGAKLGAVWGPSRDQAVLTPSRAAAKQNQARASWAGGSRAPRRAWLTLLPSHQEAKELRIQIKDTLKVEPLNVRNSQSEAPEDGLTSLGEGELGGRTGQS